MSMSSRNSNNNNNNNNNNCNTNPILRRDDDETAAAVPVAADTPLVGNDNYDDDKGQTFRKRRLSLTLQAMSNNHHAQSEVAGGNQVNDGANNEEEEDEDEEGIDDDDFDDEEDEEDDNQSHTVHIKSMDTFHSPTKSVSPTATTGGSMIGAVMNAGTSNHISSCVDDETKALTFRKRRLSLTTSGGAAAAVAAAVGSMPNTDTNSAYGDLPSPIMPPQSESHRGFSKSEFRRSSMDSHSSMASSIGSHDTTTIGDLISRTLHAGELIGTDGTLPPSPAHGPSFSTHFLYQPTSGTSSQHPRPRPPPPPPVLELGSTAHASSTPPPDVPQQPNDANSNSNHHNHHHNHTNDSNNHHKSSAESIATQPKWKRRHTLNDPNNHHKLPFSRDVVGTYSCHGVEPVYNDVYIRQGVNDEDDDDQHSPSGLYAGQHVPTTVSVAKINQDRGGVVGPYRNHPRTALFAVYDGHGHGGESVSQFALYEIQRRLEKHVTFETDIERALKETFVAVDGALIGEPLIDPMFAGTTACVVLLQDQQLTIANSGDSRAVCARRKHHHHQQQQPSQLHSNVGTNDTATATTVATTQSLFQYDAIDLSYDQNPDVPQEMERIQKSGGYVSLPPGPGLSARVWLDPRCTQVGLAMSRSIGDHAISTVGVIAEPVVTYHEMTDEDEFFIVATDGVWEFLDSTEAVNIVGNNLHRGSTKACQALIEAAAARWYEEEGAYRDDITAIVVRVKELWKKHLNGKKAKS